MPGFIKTKGQEARWQVAKKAAAKSKGKSSEELKGDDFALVNYIYHKMGKNEEDVKKAEELKKALIGKAPFSMSTIKNSTRMPSIASTKTGTTMPTINSASTKIKGTETPKQKTMPTISDNAAKHFKPLKASEEKKSETEEFEHMKHPSLHKLLEFIKRKRKKISNDINKLY